MAGQYCQYSSSVWDGPLNVFVVRYGDLSIGGHTDASLLIRGP
jgi:hypothetical protein